MQLPGTHLDEQYFLLLGRAWTSASPATPPRSWSSGRAPTPRSKDESDLLRLLARIHLMRISAADQAAGGPHVFDFYGERLQAFALDKTGNGLPLWQELDPEAVGTAHGPAPHARAHQPADQGLQLLQQGRGGVRRPRAQGQGAPRGRRDREERRLLRHRRAAQAGRHRRGSSCPTTASCSPSGRARRSSTSATRAPPPASRPAIVGGSLHTLDAAFKMIAGKSLQGIEEALKVGEAPRPGSGPVRLSSADFSGVQPRTRA
jgi:hypothetical protein